MLVILFNLVLCLLAVDLISGIMHWAEDTWAVPGTSKFLDQWIILPNIDHHRRPGEMRRDLYWETNLVSVVLASVVIGIMALLRVDAWQAYLIVAMASQGNQIHAWAYGQEAPRFVGWLQRLGILQSVRHHGEHHKRPYACRFCTTTNFLNPILDAIAFWRGLEWVVQRFGIKVKRATPERAGF
jgi:hypothetical protein